MKIKRIIWLLTLTCCLFACRKDDDIVMPTIQDTHDQVLTECVGLYVLCEGNMGANKATLDYTTARRVTETIAQLLD